MKKATSILLAVLMLFSILPLGYLSDLPFFQDVKAADPQAEEDDEKTDYIYYSDLFYQYPFHLPYSSMLIDNELAAENAMVATFNEYINSLNLTLAGISGWVNLWTNPAELLKTLLERFGISDNSYNELLDAANQIFISRVLSDEVGEKINDINSIKKEGKFLKQAKKMLSTMQKMHKAVYDVGEEKTYEDVFGLTLAQLKLDCTHLGSVVPSLASYYTGFSEVLHFANDISEVAEIFDAFILSVCMEDIRFSIIDDIIATQPSDSILYEGMTRLRSQMDAGWLGYFVDTYFTKKLLNNIAQETSKWITTSVLETSGSFIGASLAEVTAMKSVFSAFSATISLMNTAIFDWILQIPSIKQYQITMVLAQYSKAMYDSILQKQKRFLSQFPSSEIEKYETLFDCYVSAVNCALSECEGLQSSLSAFSEETLQKLSLAKNCYSDVNYYSHYIDDVKETIKGFSPENIHIAEYGDWNLSQNFTLAGGSDVIEPGVVYCNGIRANLISSSVISSKAYLQDNQNVLINGDFIYEHQIFTLTVPEQATLTANNIKIRSVGSTGSGGGTFYNKGVIVAQGNFDLIGSYSYTFGGAKGVYTENSGSIIAHNNMTFRTVADNLKNSGLLQCGETFTVRDKINFQNSASIITKHFVLLLVDLVSYPVLSFSDSSVMKVSGNMDCSSYSQTIGGTLVLNGDTQQKLKGLHVKNLTVDNACGINNEGGMQVYGYFNLNKNPIVNTGSEKPRIYSSTTLDSVSDYGDLLIEYKNQITLMQNVTANFTGDNEGEILIPKEASVVINGNINMVWGKFTNNGSARINGDLRVSGRNSGISNSGDLFVSGNLTMALGSNREYGTLVMQNPNACLSIGGNAVLAESIMNKISQGTLVFSGLQKQTVENLYAPIMIIENASEEGVVFNTRIIPSILFDHRQNHFTLNAGGAFVDYDGDGLKDNVDPYPTIGNACTLLFQSNNPEFGSVSESEIHTTGGTTVSVKATPAFKYRFLKWIDASNKTLSTEAEYTFVAKNNQTITAVFEKRQQPITTQTENGRIIVPSFAEIDSEVTVSVEENPGYIFDPESLCYNGVRIENDRFIMPDCPVVVTAVFHRNDAYFALKSKIDEGSAISFNDYSAESFAVLTEALASARAVLTNYITQEESERMIAAIATAIEGLSSKYAVSVSVRNTPTLYVGIDNLREQITVSLNFDNGTEELITDYTISNYEPDVIGEQDIVIEYLGFSVNYKVTVQHRLLSSCLITDFMDDLVYTGSSVEQDIIATYSNGDVLVQDVDFTVSYTDNVTPGLASMEIIGIGLYTGTIIKYFNVICNHSYEVVEYVPATCTETGRKIEVCTVCNCETELLREYSDLPQSPHNYYNKMNAEYFLRRDNAVCYRMRFSQSTCFENNYDKLYIYNDKNELMGTYTGTALAGKTIEVIGEYVRFVLVTDVSQTYYGFSFDYVDVTYAIKRDIVIPATDHVWSEWNSLNEEKHQRICMNDASHVETEEHAWNDGEITIPATCTENGIKTFTCTVCGTEKTEPVEAIRHNYGPWTKLDESRHQRICANDPSHVETEEHVWNDGEITIPATCMENGIKIFTCTVCGAEKTESVEALKHNYGLWTKLDEVRHQRICANDPSHVETEEHVWNDGEITIPATCTENGIKTFTCTVCGTKRTESIASTSHTDQNSDGWCDTCSAELYSHDSADDEKCRYCGERHTGFFGRIVRFFHNIIYFFKNLFR